MAIYFYEEDIKKITLQRLKIKSWIKSSLENENFKIGDINFIFCSDEYLLNINKQYLDHDYYTDIITFDYVENKIISGDLFISIDRVMENSKSLNISFSDELKRIIIHGILHLMGYKDKEENDKKKMIEKEDFYLSKSNF